MEFFAGLPKATPPRRSRSGRFPGLAWAARAATALLRGSCALLVLSLALRCGGVEDRAQPDAYTATLREYLARQDKVRSNELYQLQLAADGQRRTAFEAALTEHLQGMENPTVPTPVVPPDHNHLVWLIIGTLTLILGLRVPAPRIAAYLARRFDPWAPSPASAAAAAGGIAPHLLVEDPAWVGFLRAMEEGLRSPARDAVAPSAAAEATAKSGHTPEPLRDAGQFFDSAPKQLAALRSLFSGFGRAEEGANRSAKTLELLREVQAFKDSALAPELLPVRQLTSALAGLLNQLSKQPANITPSTVRTVAAAVDLLGDLCVRGVKPNLASEPPVRLLAVDDEPLTRGLVSRALQKVFGAPDLAPGGTDALVLAEKQAYDLIFLDVEMPGMDGFELCQKLHQTQLNAATPVIFVTRSSDFNSRAKSTLHGAQDLIAKPFLAFELALKALTLILRTRLTAGSAAPEAAPAPVAANPRPAETLAQPAPAPVAPALPEKPLPASVPTPVVVPAPPAPARPAVAGATTLTATAKALLAKAATQFQSFHDQLSLVRSSAKPEEINALLAKFYPTIASFGAEAYAAKLNAAFRLGSALEAMLKKLLEKPRLRPPSTLESVGLALDVLVELAQSGKDLDLDQAPARLLVVDDDLLARRMMGEALQLAFGRPEDADSGEAALALANTKPFDLIYLDVLMPGMDGFAACAEIRQSALNRNTPVMFVTSQNDLESRHRAAASGGSGFIAKPTLPCEITLVTVSLLLRHRLAASPQAAEATPATESKEEKPAAARVLPRKQRRHQAARQRRNHSAQPPPPPEPALKHEMSPTPALAAGRPDPTDT